MTGTTAYALAAKKTASVVAGIDHWYTDDVEKTITCVTTDGTELTLHFQQPSDGASIVDVQIRQSDNHLIFYYSNGTTSVSDDPVPTVAGFSPTVNVYRNTDDQYVLDITTKDSHYLTPNLKGHDGQDGKSFTIKAQYPTYESLVAAHPTGQAGDAYFVGEDTSPDLYVWLTDDNVWYNSGKIAGIKGDPGRGILSFEVSNEDHLLVNMDDGTVEDTGVIPVVRYEIVEALPTENISTITIYLVPIEGEETGSNLYTEYIYVYKGDDPETGDPVYEWEQLGTRTVDAEAKLKNPMTATKAVGGVSVGKTWAADTELETILRDVLSPVLYPSLVAPSASLGKNPSTTLLEKGATLAVTFTVNLNRGSISPAYGTSGYRSGAANGYSLNGGTKQTSNSFSETVSESNKTFTGRAFYDAGEQPKDSAGQNYSSPLPAGFVDTATTNYEFVSALWANTTVATNIIKQALVSKSAKVQQFNFPSTTATNPEVFDVPADYTVTAVEVLNSLSNQWETATAQFTVTSTTHDNASGTSQNYNRYTCNLGYDLGARNVRVKWS